MNQFLSVWGGGSSFVVKKNPPNYLTYFMKQKKPKDKHFAQAYWINNQVTSNPELTQYIFLETVTILSMSDNTIVVY